MMLLNKNISIQQIIGKGYASLWNFKGNEAIIMGSKSSKKSKTIALRWIKMLKQYPRACLLATRNTANTMRDSVWADLQWAAYKLHLDKEWEFNRSPLEATNTVTGQKIFFRGLDDWQKIASITIHNPNLVLCWIWFEEAYEIEEEKTYTNIRFSIRGQLPEGYFKQSVASFNPWNEEHFLVQKLIKHITPDEQILEEKGKQECLCKEVEEIEIDGKQEQVEIEQLLMITNHHLNEFLSPQDIMEFKQKKKDNIEEYKTVGLGMPGTVQARFFAEFRKQIHVIEPFEIPAHWKRYAAFDYGLDMFACLWFARDTQGNAYAYREAHKSDLIISEAAQLFKELNGNDNLEYIYAPRDLWNRRQETGKSAEEIFYENGVDLTPTSVDRIDGWLATKEWLKVYTTRDVETGEEKQDSSLKIFKECEHLIRYLPQAQKDEKNSNDMATEPHYLTHICDALRYFCVNFTNPAEEPRQDEEEEQDRINQREFQNYINYGMG